MQESEGPSIERIKIEPDFEGSSMEAPIKIKVEKLDDSLTTSDYNENFQDPANKQQIQVKEEPVDLQLIDSAGQLFTVVEINQENFQEQHTYENYEAPMDMEVKTDPTTYDQYLWESCYQNLSGMQDINQDTSSNEKNSSVKR